MCEENLRGSKHKLSVWKKEYSLWIEWLSELNVECKELLKMQKYEWILRVYVKNAGMKKWFEYMKKIKVWMDSNSLWILCIYENQSNLIELGESMYILAERINAMRSMCMINIWKKYVSRWVSWSFDS